MTLPLRVGLAGPSIPRWLDTSTVLVPVSHFSFVDCFVFFTKRFRMIQPSFSTSLSLQPAGLCIPALSSWSMTGAPRSVCSPRVGTVAWGRKARLLGLVPRSASAHPRRNASAGAAAACAPILGCVQAGFGGQPASVNFGESARDFLGRGPDSRTGSLGGGCGGENSAQSAVAWEPQCGQQHE